MKRVDGHGMEEDVGNGVVDGLYFCQSLVSTDEWKQAAHPLIIDPLAAYQTVESSRGELDVMVNKGVNGERKGEKRRTNMRCVSWDAGLACFFSRNVRRSSQVMASLKQKLWGEGYMGQWTRGMIMHDVIFEWECGMMVV